MDAGFWTKLALSFLVGSGWIVLCTAVAERHGTVLGGLVGGLPSTVFVSLLFIGFTQDVLAAAETTTLMPLTQGVSAVFVVAYLVLVRRAGLLAALSGALAVWALLAAGAAGVAGDRLWASVAGWLLLSAGSYLFVERRLRVPSRPHLAYRCTRAQLLLRALFGGSVIVVAVGVAKLLGPAYGGIMATFPTTFLSTLAITYRAGGAEFSRAVGKALLTSGMVNAALYPIAVRYLYPPCGLLAGTALALAFSCFTAYLTYRFMHTLPTQGTAPVTQRP